MARIKNWTVISQRVKERQDGLVTYSKYLLDEKHKNHSKNETRIVPLHGKMNEFVKSSIWETLDFDMSNKNVGEELWDGYHDDMINAFYDGYSQAQDKYRAYKKDNKSKEN